MQDPNLVSWSYRWLRTVPNVTVGRHAGPNLQCWSISRSLMSTKLGIFSSYFSSQHFSSGPDAMINAASEFRDESDDLVSYHMAFQGLASQWTHYVVITSLLRQNNVATSFGRINGVISFASRCVRRRVSLKTRRDRLMLMIRWLHNTN